MVDVLRGAYHEEIREEIMDSSQERISERIGKQTFDTIVDLLVQRVVKGFIEDTDFRQERISERIGEWAVDVSSGKQMVDVLTQVVMQEILEKSATVPRSAHRRAGGNILLRCPCRTS